MKLLIATPLYPPDIGGPAKYAKEIHEELLRRGHTAIVVSYTSLERSLPMGLRHASYALRLLPRIISADAVLALDTWLTGIPVLIFGKIFRKKILIRIGGDIVWEWYVARTKETVHLSEFYTSARPLSMKEKFIYKGTKFLLLNSDALLFNSAWLRDIWQPVYRFDANKAVILENHFPAKQHSYAPAGQIFVAAGRETVLKRRVYLRAVITALKQKYPAIEIDERPLPPKEHIERLSRAYAVIVSSISEVNPNTVIEAVSLNKPFIAPFDCGLREKLAAIGNFIDTTDEKALTKSIEELLDPKEYSKQVERLSNFTYVRSWADIADEVLEVIKKVCAS